MSNAAAQTSRNKRRSINMYNLTRLYLLLFFGYLLFRLFDDPREPATNPPVVCPANGKVSCEEK